MQFCSKGPFDDVTRINSGFWFLMTSSSPKNVLPSAKYKLSMAVAAILDFHKWIWRMMSMMIDWCLSYVPNLLQISLIIREIDVFSYLSLVWWHQANCLIAYSLVIWSSLPLHIAAMHLSTKFSVDVFIRCENTSILRNSRRPLSSILELLGELWAHPRSRIPDAFPLQKFC